VWAPPPSPESARPLQIEHFDVVGELGRGGMGIVYKARHRKLERTCALKLIANTLLAGPEERDRIREEARLAAGLNHPNIVQVYEVGEHNGVPYLALEYVEGRSLDRHIAGKPQPPGPSAALVEVLARAVHFAHENRIIHRDLKPANVLLARDGTPKVADFGLAKKLDAPVGQSAGRLVGTPPYMAPEQVTPQTRELGPHTDVYALGAILYECLTGRPPFLATTDYEILMLVVGEAPVPPSRLVPRVPRDLETICLKCLEKAPGQRYASAVGLAEDLRRYQAREPILARPVGWLGRCWRWSLRHPVESGLLLALTLAIVLGFAGIIWQWRLAVRAEGDKELARAEAVENENRAILKADEADKARRKEVLARQDEARAKREESAAKNKALLAEEESRTQFYFQSLTAIDHEWLQGNLPRAREMLAACRPPGLPPWEWRYLDRLCRRPALLTTALSPNAYAGLALSPDGRYLALARSDGLIEAWRFAKRSIGTVWPIDRAFSRERPRNHGAPVLAVAVSPDSRFLATAGKDGSAKVWDLRGIRPTVTLKTTAAVHTVAFSPDGKTLAAGSADSTVHLWKWQTDDKPVPITIGKDSRRWWWAGFAGDNHLVLASVDGILYGLGLAGPKKLFVHRGHEGLLYGLAMAPGGARFATWDWDGTVKIWDAKTGAEVRSLHGPGGPIWCASFSSDGRRLAAAGTDQMIQVWDVSSGRPLLTLRGHAGAISGLAFYPGGPFHARADERLVSTGWDGSWRAWSTQGPQEVLTLRGHRNSVAAVAFSPDSKRLASAAGRDVKLWEAQEPKLLHTLSGHQEDVRAVAFSPDGQLLASASADRTVKLWALQSLNEPPQMLLGHTAAVNAVAFSADGKHLASASDDGSARVWDMTDRAAAPLIFRGHNGKVLSVALRPGQLATSGADRTVKLWALASPRQPVLVLSGFSRAVQGLAFSPGGTKLATVGGKIEGSTAASKYTGVVLEQQGDVRVWDLGGAGKDKPPFVALVGHKGEVKGVAFSPDGKRLVTGGGEPYRREVKVWDVARRRELLALHGHSGYVRCVALSPNGHRIAAGGGPIPDGAGEVWVWDGSP
jgi:WD40 repeat protein/tRNA A-37 threonylcarbamoyl transferase component Bud32